MRVLLVDDHPTVLMGLKSLLGNADSVEVVGETGRVEEVLRLAENLRPDLVVLDLWLGGNPSGIDLCQKLKRFEEPPQVLLYSGDNSREYLATATLAGADSYLHKGVSGIKLVEALRRTCAGECVLELGFRSEQELPRISRLAEFKSLTPKEKEVLALVRKRLTNAEISSELFITLPTTKTHVSHIMRKFGAKRRTDLF